MEKKNYHILKLLPNAFSDERSLINYAGMIPEILRYQIFTKLLLFVLAYGFRILRNILLWTARRSAFTSGDLKFMLTSVQGWFVIILGFWMLVVYLVFDINAMILLSSRVLHQQQIRVRDIVKEAFASLKLFRQPIGIAVLIFVAFLVPLSGVGLGISLTKSLYIPDFITAVIEEHRIYNLLYTLGLLLILAVTLYYLFTFHCVILGKDSIREGKKRAGWMMRTNWKNFLRRYLSFFLRSILVGILIIAVVAVLIIGIDLIISPASVFGYRFEISFSAYLIVVVAYGYFLLFTPFQMIMLTRIYESYTEEDEGEIKYPPRRHHRFMALMGVALLIFMVVASYGTAYSFDEVFPSVGQAEVIAHRGGGNLGNENTVPGLEKAIEAGADASEIDVQRTSDGYYIINHDDNFKRLAGESRTPGEMTLAEIKELTITDSGEVSRFATYEEMLDAARDRITLYVELKGDSADSQMAEDLYQITSEKGMLDQVVFICLSYPVISSLEQSHEDAQTGYLCYAAFGDIEGMEVDELLLEEETATPTNISRIQEAGKKIYVWTVNKPLSMLRFYARTVDGIITDEVDDSLTVKQVLNLYLDLDLGRELDDVTRVILRIIFVWWP